MNDVKNNKRYMRAKQVANYLSIGLSTVWFMAKQGKLHSIKLTSKVTVFDKDEIDNLIHNSTTKVAQDG